MPNIVVGIDEVGRGCLVGDVVAAAVILDPNKPIPGLTDSKKLTSNKRIDLACKIKDMALDYAIASASPAEIDRLNILQASLLAMQRAYQKLKIKANLILIDGNQVFEADVTTKAIIKGDLSIEQISAASILAKVHRDNQMIELSKIYPEYQFDKHKGYPTKLHMQVLNRFGYLNCYRKSFSPIKRMILKHESVS